MQPTSVNHIVQQLGEWPPENIHADMQQCLRLEGNTNQWHLLLPNPAKDLTLLVRPRGLQWMSVYKKQRADFALPFTQLQQVLLLPSYTILKGSPFYWLYVIPATLLVTIVGIQYNINLAFLWLVLGFVAGMILSAHYHKLYRRNLQITYTDEQQQTQTLLLSVPPKQEKQAIRFFQAYTGDRFVTKIL